MFVACKFIWVEKNKQTVVFWKRTQHRSLIAVVNSILMPPFATSATPDQQILLSFLESQERASSPELQ